MTSDRETLASKVQKSFQRLSSAAITLNTASDVLGESVAHLDASLKKLNLGITSWIHLSSWSSEDGLEYSSEDIGYAKIGGKWGIGIRTVEGHVAFDNESITEWLLNDGPRDLRIRAVPKIPDLLDKLAEDASSTAEEVKETTEDVRVLATAISSLVAHPTTTTNKR